MKAPVKGLSANVRRQATLYGAWRHVRRNGLQSHSRSIREETKKFEIQLPSNLRSIEKKLRYGKFQFEPAYGIPLARPGKSIRPIIAAPIRTRIVQRAILDVLQRQASIKRILEVETSFGGLPEKGVSNAFAYLIGRIADGYSWFLATDIADFFTQIPRLEAVDCLLQDIDDPEFRELVLAASKVELQNAEKIGNNLKHFPSWDRGVAQGFCLSPLLGNALLYDFDNIMNGRGIVCLRYIDDILFLARKPGALRSVFNSASRYLDDFDLSLYEPEDSPKASMGHVDEGISYLGCQFREGAITPSKESRTSLLSKVRVEFEEGLSAQQDLSKIRARKKSVQEVIAHVDHILQGWGNQYSFCNCPGVMKHLDNQISDLLIRFLKSSEITPPVSNLEDTRRLLGVQLLSECKQEPLIEPGWLQAA